MRSFRKRSLLFVCPNLLGNWSNIKSVNRVISIGLLKSTPFTAVSVFGTAIAWHKYQEVKNNESRE